MSQLVDLKPALLWHHFQELCNIPRPSGHEEAVIEHIKRFGEKLGLYTHVDEVGNVVIRKPATAGMENRAGVILQGHLDMVPQKNSDVIHDFLKDPVKACVDGDWVTAKGTTLGADNGIGVAAAMAVLEANDIEHGPVEVLFTVDEESGMTGAHNLKPGLLEGQIMLSLDSEEEGELCVGCAGGVDVAVSCSYTPEMLPEGYAGRKIVLRGLKGGHSGIDIVRQRGNANKLMVRLLKALSVTEARIVEFSGGSLRNAIPREAFAEVAIPTDKIDIAAHILDEQLNTFQAELAEVEPELSLSMFEAGVPEKAMPKAEHDRWLDALHVSPDGVARMSMSVADVVETSNNLAMVEIGDGLIKVENLVRSLVDSAREDHAEAIAGLYRGLGADVLKQGGYPGWKPDMESVILKVMQETHKALFGAEPEVKVIHAGLECGLLGSVYPRWDMISFGPTIQFPHSPDEGVHIPAVRNFWNYLLLTLKSIPQA